MKHEMKSVTQPPGYKLGDVGEWMASLVVLFFAIGMCLAIVCVLFSPAE